MGGHSGPRAKATLPERERPDSWDTILFCPEVQDQTLPFRGLMCFPGVLADGGDSEETEREPGRVRVSACKKSCQMGQHLLSSFVHPLADPLRPSSPVSATAHFTFLSGQLTCPRGAMQGEKPGFKVQPKGGGGAGGQERVGRKEAGSGPGLPTGVPCCVSGVTAERGSG